MAIYHANIKTFSRGKGESATAAAAYRAGIDILDTRTRTTHRYSRRGGVISHHMLAPAGAPAWCNDVAVFFDACEAWESRSNAIVGRELEVSLPAELGAQEREKLAISLGQILVDRYQAVVLVAIHSPSAKGDQRNFHTHLQMSARRVGPDGFGSRAGVEFDARGGRGAEEIRVVRALVSSTINEALLGAGITETVDHRSLHDQALAAQAVGDFDKVRELSRVPTRHIGKAITAALRRDTLDPLLAKVGITLSPAQKAMEEAEATFARQGRLIATPVADGPRAARADRLREEQVPLTEESAAPKAAPQRSPLGRLPSPAALQLGRLTRISKSQGKDAEVLNAEAKLIEEWLAAQAEAAQSALASLQAILGLRLEPEFKQAMDTAMRRRVGVYGSKRFFYEDSEVLTNAIVAYAAAIREPHEVQDRLRRARARLSEVELDGNSKSYARLSSAKRALAKTKEAVGRAAVAASFRRINEARAVMVAAREAIERDYYITPLDRVETSPPHPYTAGMGGGERKSDSNRQELKPSTRPRV